MHALFIFVVLLCAIFVLGAFGRIFSPKAPFARAMSATRRVLGAIAILIGILLVGVGGWLLSLHDHDWSLGPLIFGPAFIGAGLWGTGVFRRKTPAHGDKPTPSNQRLERP
jgi:hypothetical protein